MAEFSLEKALQAISERFTPEMRAEQAKRTREGVGRIDPNSPAAKRRRFKRQATFALAQIAALKNVPDSELKKVRMTSLLNRLAEALSEQGDFAGAIAVSQRPEQIAEYRSIEEAIAGSREITCDCPVTRARVGRDIVALNPRFKVRTIETPKGPRALIRCANCGAMNVKGNVE
jgi:hypothetical protein